MDCPVCKNTGYVYETRIGKVNVSCSTCHSTGKVWGPDIYGYTYHKSYYITCPDCAGATHSCEEQVKVPCDKCDTYEKMIERKGRKERIARIVKIIKIAIITIGILLLFYLSIKFGTEY